MLNDVTLEHLDGGRATVSYLDRVATVQPCELRAARKIEFEEAQAREIDAPTPETYAAAKALRVAAERAFLSCDAWTYTTPRGETFPHPTHAGALHMARRWFVDNGVILVPFDHSHLDSQDLGIVGRLTDARVSIDGPRVGDFVRLAGEDHTTRRICDIGFDGRSFGLTHGGSFSLGARITGPESARASYSGALDWSPKWVLDRLADTGETVKGKFWFFSHGIAGQGRGVDVALDCRVYVLQEESGL